MDFIIVIREERNVPCSIDARQQRKTDVVLFEDCNPQDVLDFSESKKGYDEQVRELAFTEAERMAKQLDGQPSMGSFLISNVYPAVDQEDIFADKLPPLFSKDVFRELTRAIQIADHVWRRIIDDCQQFLEMHSFAQARTRLAIDTHSCTYSGFEECEYHKQHPWNAEAFHGGVCMPPVPAGELMLVRGKERIQYKKVDMIPFNISPRSTDARSKFSQHLPAPALKILMDENAEAFFDELWPTVKGIDAWSNGLVNWNTLLKGTQAEVKVKNFLLKYGPDYETCVRNIVAQMHAVRFMKKLKKTKEAAVLDCITEFNLLNSFDPDDFALSEMDMPADLKQIIHAVAEKRNLTFAGCAKVIGQAHAKKLSKVAKGRQGKKKNKNTKKSKSTKKVKKNCVDDKEEKQSDCDIAEKESISGECKAHTDGDWIQCDLCDTWFHVLCVKIDDVEFDALQNVDWFCKECTIK